MDTHKATVSESIRATPTVGVVRLRFAGGVPFTHQAGQYVLVSMEMAGKRRLKPYSIASAPSELRFIELCVKDVPGGEVSHRIVSLKKGDTVQVSGPRGLFILQPPAGDVVFAATGTGISALKPMIETLFEQQFAHQIYLFSGAKTADEIVYRPLFEALAKLHTNFHFIPVVSRDDAFPGEKGHVQDAIPKQVQNPKGKDIYICGVLAMVEETVAWAEQYGFERARIHVEKYV